MSLFNDFFLCFRPRLMTSGAQLIIASALIFIGILSIYILRIFFKNFTDFLFMHYIEQFLYNIGKHKIKKCCVLFGVSNHIVHATAFIQFSGGRKEGGGERVGRGEAYNCFRTYLHRDLTYDIFFRFFC